jgi:hypothetical protein
LAEDQIPFKHIEIKKRKLKINIINK